ncbi:MAG TPA: IPT/TIG domain-containing protein [Acidimicrobiales bacterium]|nr:IPT/TIG domain-containing protein [Acidimicrobiales bacterium]
MTIVTQRAESGAAQARTDASTGSDDPDTRDNFSIIGPNFEEPPGSVVVTWGHDNSFGQLGNGTARPNNTPAFVPGLTKEIKAVSAGSQHTLALVADGSILTWGANEHGQLGNGTTSSSSVPVEVEELSGAVAIAAGGAHSLAIKADGTVLAWGGNARGQLGDGSTTDRLLPVVVPGLTDVISVSAAYGHSLAAKSDGTVLAWGANDSGQLGDGTTMERRAPVVVPGVDKVVAVAGGGHLNTAPTGEQRFGSSFALGADGSLVAWGKNTSGQLGDGSFDDRLSPVAVSGLPCGVLAVDAGRDNAVVLCADGAVMSWGSSLSTRDSAPRRVSSVSDAVAVSADEGGKHLALLANGGIVDWSAADPTAVAQVQGLPTGITTVWAGGGHVVAARATGIQRPPPRPPRVRPAVTAVAPASGAPAGGNEVTLTGCDLSGATEVRFGSELAQMKLASDNELVVSRLLIQGGGYLLPSPPNWALPGCQQTRRSAMRVALGRQEARSLARPTSPRAERPQPHQATSPGAPLAALTPPPCWKAAPATLQGLFLLTAEESLSPAEALVISVITGSTRRPRSTILAGRSGRRLHL